MNKTKIDWCDYSWNPVTGCLHSCEYCYARKIANRFKDKNNLTYVDGVKPGHLSNISYPWGFLPTFHPNRLDGPQKVKETQNIFVCSMADLFGEWVPDEWIKDVFKACEKAPQHRYLFLTKNPKRFIDLSHKKILPIEDNFWYGTTATDEKSYINNSAKLYKGTGYDAWKNFKRFLSIEPLLGEIKEYVLCALIGQFDWIIVGSETGNRKNKVIPKKEWILDIKNLCEDAKVPLFMKESLRELMGQDFIQEFPWDKEE